MTLTKELKEKVIQRLFESEEQNLSYSDVIRMVVMNGHVGLNDYSDKELVESLEHLVGDDVDDDELLVQIRQGQEVEKLLKEVI